MKELIKKLFFLAVCLTIVISCSPKLGANWTQDGYAGRSYSKIAVVGISNNLKARTEFEKTAVDFFKKKGINAIEGVEVFRIGMTKAEETEENLKKLITDNKLDGVITMSLVDSEESKRYKPGETYNVAAGYYRVGKYLVRRYATVRTPGYYVPSKSYLIEAVLYDLQGDLSVEKKRLVWRGQSSLIDPSSIESAARSFTKTMVNHVVTDGIVK